MSEIMEIYRPFITDAEIEALNQKVMHFSEVKESLFEDYFNSDNYIANTFITNYDYITSECGRFKKFFKIFFDINAIFLDAILFKAKTLTNLDLKTYVEFDKENSRYILTARTNPLNVLKTDFWNSLNEFDYECMIFLNNALKRL